MGEKLNSKGILTVLGMENVPSPIRGMLFPSFKGIRWFSAVGFRSNDISETEVCSRFTIIVNTKLGVTK